MTTNLPSSLESYFTAKNRRDVNAMLVSFADDAVVKDEGREYEGVPAIRARMQAAIEKYDFIVTPTSVTRSGDLTAVTTTVSGNFPGSPATLTHWFTVDGQTITQLEIG